MNHLLSATARTGRVQAVLADFLETTAAPPTPQQVHRVRVDIKKLRGWIRLLRRAEERRIGVAADHDLRRFARALAPARDQQVAAQTLQALRAECRSDAERNRLADLAQCLRSQWHSQQRPVSMAPPGAATTRSLQNLCARQTTDTALLHGLAESYGHARRLGKQACMPNASQQRRHHWRKRVKYLAHQSSCVYRAKHSSWHRALVELGTVLGELQDLYVLRKELETLPGDRNTAVMLTTGIRLCERATNRRVAMLRHLYRRCFAERRAPFTM